MDSITVDCSFVPSVQVPISGSDLILYLTSVADPGFYGGNSKGGPENLLFGHSPPPPQKTA